MKSPLSSSVLRGIRSARATTKPLILLIILALVVGLLPSGMTPASAQSVEPQPSSAASPPDEQAPAPGASPSAAQSPSGTASPSPSPAPQLPSAQPSEPAEPSPAPAVAPPRLPASGTADAPASVPGELVERRTASTRTIANKDGSYSVESFTGPVHFQDNKGRFLPIDSTLVASEKPGYALKNRASSFRVDIKDQLGPDAISLQVAGKSFTLTPQDLDKGKAVSAGSRARFSGSAGGVDVDYEITPSGLKETITLAGPDAATTFTTLLKGPSGTQVTEEKDGSLTVRDSKGAPVFSFDPPWAEEKAELDKPERTDRLFNPTTSNASLSARAVPAGTELTLSVDAAWVKAEGRKFPLIVDPTATLVDTRDGVAYSDNPNQIYGGILSVGTSGTGIRRSYLGFDTSPVPAGSTVTGATMAANWDLCVNSGAGYACSIYNHRIDVHRITAAWTAWDPTWNWLVPNHSGVIEASYHRLASEAPGSTNTWSLTGLVQGWVNGTVANNGVMLRLADETLARGGPCYNDNANTDPAKRPKLTVTYTAPPSVPDQLAPADATRFTTTPVLQARYRSPQGTSGKVNFVVKNGAGVQVAGGLSPLVASGATASFTPPALPDGTYYWQARAEEGTRVSAWSAVNDFAVAKVAAAGPGIGQQRFYGLDSTGLTDRMGISVNPANGNFLLSASDLSIAGTGISMNVDRFYNSQSDSVYELGRGWTMGTGRDVGLSVAPDGSQQFEAPSGYRIMFTRNPDGSYVSPTGSDAVLTRNADTSFKLSFNLSSSTLNFTPGGYLSSQKDLNGNTISFAYNGESLSSSITDTQARVTTFAYTAGLLHTMTDSTGRAYKYGYDGAKNLVTYADPANKITGFAYDASGRMTQITDPKGNLTKIAYDGASRATKTTRVTDNPAGTGPATSYAYNAGSTVTTDANSNNTTSYFDSLGRITKVTDAAGNDASATYTANSNVATSTDTMSALSSYGYDGKDNLTTASSPTGAGSVNAYADAAHPYFASKATNAQGNSLAFTYDTPGNMRMSQNDLTANNQQKATFNPNGTMATSTGGNNNVTTYGYDPKGNLLTVSAPLGVGNKTFTYDGLSRVKTVTDNKAQTTTVDYDLLDRVIKLTFAGNATVINTYDDDGNLTKRDDNGGALLEATVSTTYAYDRLNRQTAKTVGGVTFTSTFDGVGNLKTVDPPSGTISYAYNSLNLLTELTEPAGAKTTFGYDDAYRRTRTTYPNGVVQTATYDASGKTKTVVGKKADGTVLTSFTYDYVNPATGNDTALAFKMTDAAGGVTNYGYDVMDRLIDANGPTGHFEYTYDGNGNRLTQKINGVLTSYTSNAADQLTAAGTTTYTYDGNGNRTTQSGGPTLTYNSRNQTTGYQLPALGSPLIDMKYLGSSQNERSKAGPATFTNGPQGVASTTTSAFLSSTTANYVRDDAGALIGQRIATASYYYLFDRLGSVVAMTDSGGNAVNRYVYDPYGNALTGTVQAVNNPWQFAGGYKDGFSGFIKFGTRYYDPVVGVWTQTDPSGQDANGYLYAVANPTNLIDPTGLAATDWLKKHTKIMIPTPYRTANGRTIKIRIHLVDKHGKGPAHVNLDFSQIGGKNYHLYYKNFFPTIGKGIASVAKMNPASYVPIPGNIVCEVSPSDCGNKPDARV